MNPCQLYRLQNLPVFIFSPYGVLMNRKIFNCDVNECIRLFLVPYGFYILLKKNFIIWYPMLSYIVCVRVFSFGCARSFAVACRLLQLWCEGQECAGSVVLVLNQGSNPRPPALEGEFLTTGLPGSPSALNFMVLPMILIHSVNFGVILVFYCWKTVYPKL